MARTPPPPDSPALLDSVNADPQQQPRAVIVLSPRQSPTPPPAPFSAEDAPAPAPAPPPRVVAASPPPPEEPLDQADHPRSLIRLLALARASFAATLATAAPTPAPAPARDPSHLTPDLYYDAAGRLRTTSSNSRVRRAVASSSATPSTSGSPRVGEEAGEDADEEALFVSSLRAGDTSRQRRRPWRAQPLDLSDADDVLSDTGWIQLGSAAAADGPEVSPEEVRAAQGALSFGGQVAYPPHQPTSSEANGTAAATDEWTFHRGAGSIWRNEPLSIPRSVPLPRVGRALALGAVAPPRGSSTAPTTTTTTFSPTNPPPALSDERFPAGRPRRLASGALGALWPSNTQGPERDDEGPQQVGGSLRRILRRAVIDSSDEDDAGAARGGEEEDGNLSVSEVDSDAESWMDEGDREMARLEAQAFAAHRTALDEFGPSPIRGAAGAGRGQGQGAGGLFTTAWETASPGPPPQRRRTREETNAMMGAALRSKKRVALLYCGGGSHGADEQEQRLPAGFSWADGGPSGAGAGCGALVCARALLEGVPAKVFEDGGRDEGAASSDLPPCKDKVADLGDGAGGQEGERVGKRGWRGCKGCLTRDVGCKRCGNHLGYRLLRPCVTCSISRPTYTSYASAVSSAAPDRAPQPLVLSAGGVTGGGVVDGLLFHYRLGSVTPLPRLVGRTPADELDAEERARARSGEGGESDDDEADERAASAAAAAAGSGRRNAPAIRRLRETPPRKGARMRWKAIPTAQRDFQDGLVGEPGDWIDPEGETWWLENGIAKHARKRTASGAWAEGGNSGVSNTDRLSSASTTVGATAAASASSSSSPSGSTLSRSHAIRLRVPLSGANGSSSSSTPAPRQVSSSRAYDRYRADAADFSRRVRRRVADPSAAGGEVVGSLERAGYGSGFELEEGEGPPRRDERARRGRAEEGGAGQRAGARRGSEVVGR